MQCEYLSFDVMERWIIGKIFKYLLSFLNKLVIVFIYDVKKCLSLNLDYCFQFGNLKS